MGPSQTFWETSRDSLTLFGKPRGALLHFLGNLAGTLSDFLLKPRGTLSDILGNLAAPLALFGKPRETLSHFLGKPLRDPLQEIWEKPQGLHQAFPCGAPPGGAGTATGCGHELVRTRKCL